MVSLLLSALALASCDVGAPPDYFVPGGGATVIGCVRLRLSGKPVEFSTRRQRIGGKRYLCLNPAYRGRGQLGIYIPSMCVRRYRLDELRILGGEIPRQAVRGYERVVWGTAPFRVRRVTARYRGGRARATVFKVEEPRRFAVFVAELPARSRCRSVEVHARPARHGTVRCRRAVRFGTPTRRPAARNAKAVRCSVHEASRTNLGNRARRGDRRSARRRRSA